MLDLIIQVVPIPIPVIPADPAYSSVIEVYLKTFGIAFSIGMLGLLIYMACDMFFDNVLNLIVGVTMAILGCEGAWFLFAFGMIPVWVFVLYIIIVVLILIAGYHYGHGLGCRMFLKPMKGGSSSFLLISKNGKQ